MLKKNGRMFLLNWKNLKVKTANYANQQLAF